MIASLLIVAISLGLLLYWFRYTCILILTAKTSRDYARQFAAANKLAYPRIQAQISSTADAKQLESLRESVHRDFEVVSTMLRRKREMRLIAAEQLILQADYYVMAVWFRASKHFAPRHAAGAVSEMCQIVHHFANSIGEQARCEA